MKDQWNNLALREKQMVSAGALVISALIIYVLLWVPLNGKINDMRNQIRHNQDLLAWMIDADKRIQAAEKTTAPNPAIHNTGSLSSIVQKQINGTPLVSSLNQLHQVENDSVQLSFQKVDFDQLMQWLTQMTEQTGLLITQMSVTPSATPGIVAVELVIKS